MTDDVEGVESSAPFALADGTLECLGVWAEPRRSEFGFTGTPTRLGTHGGPRTRAQVAVVTGGHPVVESLARTVAATPVAAADWAPTIASLLGVDLPGGDRARAQPRLTTRSTTGRQRSSPGATLPRTFAPSSARAA